MFFGNRGEADLELTVHGPAPPMHILVEARSIAIRSAGVETRMVQPLQPRQWPCLDRQLAKKTLSRTPRYMP